MQIEKPKHNNCECNCCFKIGYVYKLKYSIRHYAPPKYKELADYPRELWLCPSCFRQWREEMNAVEEIDHA